MIRKKITIIKAGNVTANKYDALNRLIATTTAPTVDTITTAATTGSTTSGSSTVGVASTAGIVAGMRVIGPGITAGTLVNTVGSSTVTLNANATATSTLPVTLAFASSTTDIVEVFSYDQVGNRLWVIDGNNLYTGFTYDGLNRLLTTTYDYGTALAKTITDAYNALNKTTRTDANSRVTGYLYDALNRLTNVNYTGDAGDNLTYTRDPVGNVLSVVTATVATRSVSYTYDKLNRQLTESSCGATQSHQYDKAGNRTSTLYGGTGRGLAYTYDALNRQLTLIDTTAALTTSLAYDMAGNVVQKTLANGTSENRVHDGRNRTSTLNNVTPVGTTLAAYAYAYDAAGNVMQVAETYGAGGLSNRTITNTYDGVYRLLTEAIATTGGSTVTTTYTYDKGQNRLSKAVSGGATTAYVIGNGGNGAGANQILSSTTSGVTTTYAYDGNGNRTGRTISGTTDVFSYDYENRLTSLDYLTGGSGNGMYTYTYDYRTRRVSRTEPGAGTTYIVFDGGVSIEEYTSTPSSPTVEYIRGFNYGGGVGGLGYSVRSGTPSFNFYDSRGDVTTKTSSTGAVTWETAYEAFGNQTASSGTTPLDRQRASTKEQDPTGLLNEGFRYRNPSTGTFLTRDPLGFKAGPNMYTYVHQNPWTRFDPEGLQDSNQQTQQPQPSPFGPHIKDVQQPAQPSPSARSTLQQTQQETSPDHKNGGFAQPNKKDCVPTATREQIYKVTGIDPGNLDKEEGKAIFNDENHNWNSGPGVTELPGNQRDIMKRHGVDVGFVTYNNIGQLLDQVGNTPVSIGGTFSNSPKNYPGHQVTVSKNPNGAGFVVTNVTGMPGVGGSEVISRQQAQSGQIPVPIGGKVYQGAPTFMIDSNGIGITATPSASSSH